MVYCGTCRFLYEVEIRDLHIGLIRLSFLAAVTRLRDATPTQTQIHLGHFGIDAGTTAVLPDTEMRQYLTMSYTITETAISAKMEACSRLERCTPKVGRLRPASDQR
jgi:hypothetical protein